MIEFPSGYYLYVGSALGGLKARIARHLRPHKPLRWHIDYLAAVAPIVEVWWQAGADKLECQWAALVRGAPGTGTWVPRFGCSDCRCPSHLVHFPSRPSAAILGAGPISTLKLISDQRSAVSGQWSAVSGQR
ncbi:MAG: GIY-YIG nuclease family protein [Dehalococcoidia bacterium]|nr:GIY-YIG nuclease family protein [Dehalococcoidia bacterium]